MVAGTEKVPGSLFSLKPGSLRFVVQRQANNSVIVPKHAHVHLVDAPRLSFFLSRHFFKATDQFGKQISAASGIEPATSDHETTS